MPLFVRFHERAAERSQERHKWFLAQNHPSPVRRLHLHFMTETGRLPRPAPKCRLHSAPVMAEVNFQRGLCQNDTSIGQRLELFLLQDSQIDQRQCQGVSDRCAEKVKQVLGQYGHSPPRTVKQANLRIQADPRQRSDNLGGQQAAAQRKQHFHRIAWRAAATTAKWQGGRRADGNAAKYSRAALPSIPMIWGKVATSKSNLAVLSRRLREYQKDGDDKSSENHPIFLRVKHDGNIFRCVSQLRE